MMGVAIQKPTARILVQVVRRWHGGARVRMEVADVTVAPA